MASGPLPGGVSQVLPPQASLIKVVLGSPRPRGGGSTEPLQALRLSLPQPLISQGWGPPPSAQKHSCMVTHVGGPVGSSVGKLSPQNGGSSVPGKEPRLPWRLDTPRGGMCFGRGWRTALDSACGSVCLGCMWVCLRSGWAYLCLQRRSHVCAGVLWLGGGYVCAHSCVLSRVCRHVVVCGVSRHPCVGSRLQCC